MTYLLPMLKQSPVMNHVKTLNIGQLVDIRVYDTKYKEHQSNNLYILYKVPKLNKGEFKKFLSSLKSKIGYVDNYLYGDYSFDFLHMLVIDFPQVEALQMFKLSKYSKMLDNLDAVGIYAPLKLKKEILYLNDKRRKALQVITKDEKLRKEMSHIYRTTIPKTVELDSKLKRKQEIFNYQVDYNYPPDIQTIIDNDIY